MTPLAFGRRAGSVTPRTTRAFVLVRLTLPESLVQRLREQVAEMLPDAPEPFTAGLPLAVAEAMWALSDGPLVLGRRLLEEPPATIVPLVTVTTATPKAAADFVRQLAAASRLTPAQAWHRVVLEFCEQTGPGREIGLEEVAA